MSSHQAGTFWVLGNNTYASAYHLYGLLKGTSGVSQSDRFSHSCVDNLSSTSKPHQHYHRQQPWAAPSPHDVVPKDTHIHDMAHPQEDRPTEKANTVPGNALMVFE